MSSEKKMKVKDTQPIRVEAKFLSDFVKVGGVPLQALRGVEVPVGATVTEERNGKKHNWVEIEFKGKKGFVDEKILAPVESNIPIIPGFQAFGSEVKVLDFANACLNQAVFAKANAAFLFALAFAEGGKDWTSKLVRGPAMPLHGAIGTYKFVQPTWDKLIEELVAGNPTKDDISFPIAQCIVSAFLAGKAATKLQSSFGEDRPVTGLDLYLVHIFAEGSAFGVKAAKAIVDAMADDENRPILEVILELYGNREKDRDALIARRADFLAGGTVKAFLEHCSKLLDKGYVEARKLGDAIKEQAPANAEAPVLGSDFKGTIIRISDRDIDALARVAHSEVKGFKKYGPAELQGGLAAVVDTILNRAAHTSSEFPNTIEGVVNKPKQFSAINPLGSWDKLPKASNENFQFVKGYIAARARGKNSVIKGATHFLNPHSANAAALTAWGNHVVKNFIKKYGREADKNIHYHGFAPNAKAPRDFAIFHEGSVHAFRGDGTSLPKTHAIMANTTPKKGKNIVPASWMPAAKMDRIICHWTAGSHRASSLDRHHYHILVEVDGKLVLGQFSIKANEVIVPKNYAAHTLNKNTKSIGITVCCMRDAEQKPFNPGPSPMTKVQWEVMAAVAADLCRAYNIPVTPQTVLGHGEVERILGVKQEDKWDPLKQPWNPAANMDAVGDEFRAQVKAML